MQAPVSMNPLIVARLGSDFGGRRQDLARMWSLRVPRFRAHRNQPFRHSCRQSLPLSLLEIRPCHHCCCLAAFRSPHSQLCDTDLLHLQAKVATPTETSGKKKKKTRKGEEGKKKKTEKKQSNQLTTLLIAPISIKLLVLQQHNPEPHAISSYTRRSTPQPNLLQTSLHNLLSRSHFLGYYNLAFQHQH